MPNKELLEKVRDWGCHCDLTVGYSCGCTTILNLLKEHLVAVE